MLYQSTLMSQKLRNKIPVRLTPSRSPFRTSFIVLGSLLLLIGGLATAVIVSLPSSSELSKLRNTPLRDTATMRARRREAAEHGRSLHIHQQWVNLSQISRPALVAVLASEDARFFAHRGVDLNEINDAIHDTVVQGRSLRGASTLTQQVAKNIYLSEDRSLLRKAKEALIAWELERTLSKQQVLRLYLNIAEWGEGVFGIEAAAQTHLRKHASQISLAEAAVLAAMLPNPHRFQLLQPRLLHSRALNVLNRIQEENLANSEEIDAARERLNIWLGSL